MNVSDSVRQRAHEWGSRIVYGYPGDGVGGLDVAVETAGDLIQFGQVRHEEMTAFMVTAHAKFTGEIGLHQHDDRRARARKCLAQTTKQLLAKILPSRRTRS